MADHVPAPRQGLRRLCAHDEGIEQIGTPDTGSDRLLAELTQRFGKRKAAAGPVVLRLQPSEVVETRISVPAAAREVMEPILRNQIERLAPWPVEKALFAYEVADEAGEAGSLAVQLTVTGRNVVEGLVAELDGLGYAPDIVDCGTDAAAEPRINLLPRQSAEADRSGRVLVSVVAVALLLSLFAGAIGAFGLGGRGGSSTSSTPSSSSCAARARPTAEPRAMRGCSAARPCWRPRSARNPP